MCSVYSVFVFARACVCVCVLSHFDVDNLQRLELVNFHGVQSCIRDYYYYYHHHHHHHHFFPEERSRNLLSLPLSETCG